jgi:hypothetical protein
VRFSLASQVHFVVDDFPLNMTRDEHNDWVCCMWPPREEFNKEDCYCTVRARSVPQHRGNAVPAEAHALAFTPQ